MGFFIARTIQIPFLSIAVLTQVFVGKYLGSRRLKKIGPCVWQMIWFALLSTLVSCPACLAIGKLYFKETAIASMGMHYLTIASAGLFLIPLSVILGAFYVGQGHTKFVVAATLAANGLNLLLDAVLIFGVEPWIPRLEVAGAALGAALSQGAACLFLLIGFLKKANQERYGTGEFRLRPARLWKYLCVGIPRGLGRVILHGIWLTLIWFLFQERANYLAMISIGLTVGTFFTFIGDALQQAVSTLAARVFGAKQFATAWKLLKAGSLFLSLLAALLAIPFLLFPNAVVRLFAIGDDYTALLPLVRPTMAALWLYLVSYIFFNIGLGLILAAEETRFYFRILPLSAIVLIPLWLLIRFEMSSPAQLWIFIAVDVIIFAAAFLIRMRRKIHDRTRVKNEQLQSL